MRAAQFNGRAGEPCLSQPAARDANCIRPYFDFLSVGPSFFTQVSQVLTVISFYILISAGLISLNKFLMSKDVFPFPVTLVLVHSGFNVFLAGTLYAIAPSLFGSVQKLEKNKPERIKVFKRALPIGVLFTLELIFGNAAYMYSSIPFLQMMKESAVVWVYLLSLLVRLEDFTWQKTCIIATVLVATTMTVRGEANFVLIGFILQGAAISCSCLKTVLQSLLLSGPGTKLDAASYVLVVMPICFMLLSSCCLLALLVPGNHHLPMPSWDQFVRWFPHIMMSSVLAAGLNFAIAVLIWYTSAMGFVLTGIVKDSAIVCLGWLLMGEAIAPLQIVGFVLQMICVASWASFKLVRRDGEAGEPALQTGKLPRELEPDYGAVNDGEQAAAA